MDFKQPVVVIPTQEVSDMIAAIRMHQAQIAKLQTPYRVESSIDNVKRSTSRKFEINRYYRLQFLFEFYRSFIE